MKILYGIIFLLYFDFTFASTQDTIRLRNPSFEDFARCCKPPEGWESLDFKGHTPPDVQPGAGFGVATKPYHGNTYLGMVTREDGTFETVYQKLSQPFIAGQCYQFSVFICKSDIYKSGLHSDPRKLENFSSPIKLVVLAGHTPQDSLFEILGESALITNTRWLPFNFEIKPTQDFKFIILSAFFESDDDMKYNGHILVDRFSDIIPCPMAEE